MSKAEALKLPQTSGTERYKDGTEVIFVSGTRLSEQQAKEYRKSQRYHRRLADRHLMAWDSRKTYPRFSFANAESSKD